MPTLEEARAALRERQGEGARWDSPAAPARELDWARRGTACFARLLNDLADAALDRPSLVPGWSRRHVVAQVGYQARALTRLTEWAAGGPETPMYASEQARLGEIEDGATLPSRALRGLFRHAAVHLDVEWRDLTADAWNAPLRLAGDRPGTTRDTPLMRAREVWLRAIDLDAGGSFRDMPAGLVDLLLDEACREWTGDPLTLVANDRGGARMNLGRGGGVLVAGNASDLLRWVGGRGERRLSHDDPLPVPPSPPR